MLRPSLEQFEALARRGNLIPVAREILADLDTPLSLFRRLDDGATSFLFESVEGGEKWARYSFLGTGARASFSARGREVEWTDATGTHRETVDGDPLAFLRDKLSEFQHVTLEDADWPRFIGGAVGMIGYDWVRFVERLPEGNPDALGLPDLSFVLPELVVVYDNVRHTALIVRHAHIPAGADAGEIAKIYAQTAASLEEAVKLLRTALPADPRRAPVQAPMEVERSMTREAFHEIVKRAKEYIEAGEIFQVVLSQQLRIAQQVESFWIYRHLRAINPSPYLFFLRMNGYELVGSSPEILVRLEDGKVDVRPIAGTRRRGRSPEDDLFMEQELLGDPKELSEHVMLVDLGRNDVGRVAEIGSVLVDQYAKIERYSHVMHIVSNVQGRLRPELNWHDLLRATFPAGTLSGAPKVRAMEIIDELETVGRGPYGGCVGYIDYSGNMDMAITIRTMVIGEGQITVQAGAGVVADSSPELEWKETNNKAQAMIQAIDMAREGCD